MNAGGLGGGGDVAEIDVSDRGVANNDGGEETAGEAAANVGGEHEPGEGDGAADGHNDVGEESSILLDAPAAADGGGIDARGGGLDGGDGGGGIEDLLNASNDEGRADEEGTAAGEEAAGGHGDLKEISLSDKSCVALRTYV